MSSVYYNLFVVLSMFPFETAKIKFLLPLIDHNINNFSSEEHLPGSLCFFNIRIAIYFLFLVIHKNVLVKIIPFTIDVEESAHQIPLSPIIPQEEWPMGFLH